MEGKKSEELEGKTALELQSPLQTNQSSTQTTVFDIKYTHSQGPVPITSQIHKEQTVGLALQSPQGTASLLIAGKSDDYDAEIQDIRQSLIQDWGQHEGKSKIQEKSSISTVEQALNQMGIVLKPISHCQSSGKFIDLQGVLNEKVQRMHIILREDYGSEISMMALFKGDKNFYRVESSRLWPGYQY